MKLINKSYYVTDNSDLKVFINNIYFVGSNYYKVRLCLFHKKHNYIYEYNKAYKLYKDNISHWKIYKESYDN
jgi:hypothetical protein